MGYKILLLVFLGIVIISGFSFSFFTVDALNDGQVNGMIHVNLSEKLQFQDTLSSNMIYTRTISDSVLVDDKL